MKKKICFIVSAPGTARSFLKIPIQKLSKEYDIHLVANSDVNDSFDDLCIKDFKNIRIERRPKLLLDIKCLWQLYKYFRKNRFYAVHSYTLKASLLTAVAGKIAGIPHRTRNFSGQLWCNMTGIKRRFYKTIEHIIVACDNHFMVDCNGQRQYLIDQGILKSPDQAFIPANGSVCGVDIERFSFSEEKRLQSRKDLGLHEETVVFIFLGRIRREKGIYEILGAFNKLAGEKSNVFLLLVGNTEEDCLKRLDDYPNIIEEVNFHYYGYTKQPEYLLHAADVFVFPSYREGFGLSVIEASCVGLPVICSDTYGVMDAMVDDVTGLRCKTRDSESLYLCMKCLYDNPCLRKKLGSAGMKRAINDFPSDKVTDAWVEFYRIYIK